MSLIDTALGEALAGRMLQEVIWEIIMEENPHVLELVKARECSNVDPSKPAFHERQTSVGSETWTPGSVAKTYKRHTIQFLLLQLAASLDMSTVGSAQKL